MQKNIQKKVQRKILKQIGIGFLGIIFLLLCCTGCAFVSIPWPLGPSFSELREKTVWGEGQDKILMLDISGTISEKDKTNALGSMSELNPVARIREELEKAREDQKIKALLLKINSPGGTVTASDIIYHELKDFREETGLPIVVSMMDLAASGGYYVAMAGTKIMAHPTTITGSIGVMMMKFDVQGLMEKIGVKEVTIKSGDKKDFSSIFHTLRPEDQAILQNIIDTMYARFVEVVAESRTGLSRPEIKKIADGRVYTAQEALELKLIDAIGYLEDSIELAKKEAGLTKAKVVVYQRPSNPKQTIYAQSSVSSYAIGASAINPFAISPFLISPSVIGSSIGSSVAGSSNIGSSVMGSSVMGSSASPLADLNNLSFWYMWAP